MAAGGSASDTPQGMMSSSEASSSASIDAAAAVPDIKASSQERVMSLPAWHVDAVRGRRPRMEDAYCHGTVTLRVQAPAASGQPQPQQQQQVMVGGCFDGHGGDSVAKYIARNIPDRICSRLSGAAVSRGSVAAALSAAFTDLDQELHDKKAASLKGSTALVALVTRSTIHISSCGDSRAVIISKSAVVQPVEDHAPTRADEQARIRQAGGQVFYHNGCRVMGALAMSRAIGDHALRPYGVIADPDVAHYSRQPGDEFLLLASDGLWAVFSNEDAGDLVRHAVAELTAAGMSRQQVAAVLPKLLIKVALARGSSDNITVLVMDLQDGSSGSSSSSDSTPRCSSNGQLAADTAAASAAASDEDSSASTEAVEETAAAARVAKVCVHSRRSSADAAAVLNAAAAERMKDIIRTAAAAAAEAQVASVADAAAAATALKVASAARAEMQAAASLESKPSTAGSLSPSPFAAAATAADTSGATAAVAAVNIRQLLQLSKSAPAPLAQQQQQQQQSAGAAAARSMACRSRSVSTSISPFAVAAAAAAEQHAMTAGTAATALQSLGANLDHCSASPFLSMQRASLAQVWRDWANMQQQGGSTSSSSSPSTSSGSTASGLQLPDTAAAGGASMVGQKRRMVTTESPGLGSLGLLSAPAKLQRGDDDATGHAMRLVTQQQQQQQQRWIAAAQKASQLALQVEA